MLLEVVPVHNDGDGASQSQHNRDSNEELVEFSRQSFQVHVSPWGEPHAVIIGNPAPDVKCHGDFFEKLWGRLDIGARCAYNVSVQTLLLTREQAASLLGVGQGTVSLLASDGRLDTVTLPNGATRYTRASVMAFGGANEKAPALGEGGHVGETMNQRQCTTAVMDGPGAGVLPLVPESRMVTFSSGKLNISGTMRVMGVGEFLELPSDGASPWYMARKQGVTIKMHRIAGKLYAERVK